jgi:quercetin dioxygenase-like cupin family protein
VLAVDKKSVFRAAERPGQHIRPDLLGTVIPAEHGTLVRWVVEANQPETPLHSHPEFEQITIVMEGRLQTTVDGETFVLETGDVLRIDRGALHGKTTALDGRATMVLDVFMPPRQQYLDAAKVHDE